MFPAAALVTQDLTCCFSAGNIAIFETEALWRFGIPPAHYLEVSEPFLYVGSGPLLIPVFLNAFLGGMLLIRLQKWLFIVQTLKLIIFAY
jgi:hypothetical protein